MYLLGRILGWLIAGTFLLTVLNYPARLVFKRYFAKLPRDSKAKKRYQAFLRRIAGWHRYYGFIATGLLFIHFSVQYFVNGLYRPTCFIVGPLLIIQILLGAYGTYIRKRKPSAWLIGHRATAILLVAAIVFHAAQRFI
jgi:hypothetical protein